MNDWVRKCGLSGLFLLCFFLPGQAQDSLFHAKKSWGAAAGLAVGSNIGVWAFNRYVSNADHAYISIHTIKENFRSGFVWDNDQVGTNMFWHPYQGSLYFNAARANGFSFWQSGIFNFAGSFMWEMYMENEYPSVNDIVATPVGGLIFGEVFYRMSDWVLDGRTGGWNRFGREAAGFLISPMRGLNRIIRGDAWRKSSASGREFGTPDIHAAFSIGMRALELQDDLFDKGVGMTANICLEYGDRFDAGAAQPYDYFTFNADMHIQKSQPFIGMINIKGRLWTTALLDSPKDFLSLGVYQHFDYYDSDVISEKSASVPYRFSAPASFGLGLFYDNKRPARWKTNAFFHSNVILIGASLSDYYMVGNRNYNLANGFSWQLGANLHRGKKFSAALAYEGFLFFTMQGYDRDIDWNTVNPRTLNAQGDESQALVQAVRFKMEFRLTDKLYLTGTYSNFFRQTNYRYFDKVFSQTSEGKLMITIKI